MMPISIRVNLFYLGCLVRDTVTKQVSVLGSLREEKQAQWGGMWLCFGVAVVWKSKECAISASN